MIDRGILSTRRKPRLSVTLIITRPTGTVQELNPCFSCEEPATNRL